MASDVPAVDAAVRIVERLAGSSPTPVSAGRLVKDFQLNRSTCYNILTTLQRAGWVSSLGERAGWTVGPKLLALTDGAAEHVLAMTQQELDKLSEQVHLLAFIVEMDGAGNFTVTAKADRHMGVRVTVGLGDRFPFAAPALMQAVSAWLPEDVLDRLMAQHPLVPFTPHTVVDVSELKVLLKQVRAEGFSRSLQQFDLAQAAVAAPVFDARGRPHRAVCCLAFSSELQGERVEAAGRAVRDCAERITARTGGVPPERNPGAAGA